jgi:23S rRNA (cytosine1962-C5)-methyltransferase
MNHIILKSGKDKDIRKFYPWVFSGSIKKTSGTINEGEIITVYDNKSEYLGTGFYQSSPIAVRIFSFTDEKISETFWFDRIKRAINYRTQLGLFNLSSTNCFRLIHSEGDFLPGLIADWYNGNIVLQMHSIGMYKNKEIICSILQTILGEKLQAIIMKSSATLPKNIEVEDGIIWGTIHGNQVQENGNTFIIDWEKGQKTGFFLDQRDNRELISKYVAHKSVLNTFCYTGGFSAYALQGNASRVVSVDSSARAIDLTQETISLNYPGTQKHTALVADAFEYLDTTEDTFDVIILDPPAFAKHAQVVSNALNGYKKLNKKAIERINPGGILCTFSCSQAVSKEQFKRSVLEASAKTGRKVRIMHQMSQSTCHPVNLYHPESEYLKGLIIYVE